MAEHPHPSSAQPPWSKVWQLPAFIVGAALLLAWLGLMFLTPRQKNDFPGAMDGIAQYLQVGQFDQAKARINAILPFINQGTAYDKARLTMLEGDLVYLQQAAAKGNAQDNNKRILDDYAQARQMGMQLDPVHLQRWAQTLVSDGQEAAALKLIDEFKDQPAEARYAVLRRIIEGHLQVGTGNGSGSDRQAIEPLLTRFVQEVRGESSGAKRRSQELWATGVEAQLLLDAHQPEQSIDYLQRRLIEFMDQGGDADLGPLMVMLAKSYQMGDTNDKAQRWYRQAQQKIAKDDPLNADILVGLGQIDLAEADDFHSALEKFSIAESQYAPSVTPAHFDALVGRAYCEGQLGAHPEALEHFGRAVELYNAQPSPRADWLEKLTNAIRAHYELAFDKGDYELALDYINLMPALYQHDRELPLQLLVDLASTHEKIAEMQLAQADALPPSLGDDAKPNPERALAFQHAAANSDLAADFYLRHAHAVSASDDSAYGSSLWKAAGSYDKAQDWKKSIGVYAEFIRTRPGDSRLLEARKQMGLAYQADGQYAPAIEQFRQLQSDHPRDKETLDSLVPLAQCYLATGDTDQAKRTLLSVLNDNPDLTPEYEAYREALIELGKLYYQKEDFEAAIEKLSEAVDRYGDAPGNAGAMLRFRLADAYRRSIKALDQSIDDQANAAKKQALQAERDRRLEQGQILFSQVANELDSQPGAALSPLEALCLRNAYFYRADCAYDMRHFEQAIELYDLAAKRWENQPAALVALVQIVNAYCELGMIDKAKVANKRARSMLERIPEDAFNDPSLPMSREHWEDWLKWTSELNLFNNQATASAQ